MEGKTPERNMFVIPSNHLHVVVLVLKVCLLKPVQFKDLKGFNAFQGENTIEGILLQVKVSKNIHTFWANWHLLVVHSSLIIDSVSEHQLAI